VSKKAFWAAAVGMLLCLLEAPAFAIGSEGRAALRNANSGDMLLDPLSQTRTAHRGATPLRPGCTIKGNISRRGERIYHVPGDRYYAATVIDIAKGERWFCSEAEARAAGWRRAKL